MADGVCINRVNSKMLARGRERDGQEGGREGGQEEGRERNRDRQCSATMT